MTVNIVEENNQVIAKLIGRLDTAAATEIANEFQALTSKANGTIIIDCAEMPYISSSGLRLFLSLRKSTLAVGGNMIVRNISDDIRNVFTMTGFLNLFTIE